MSLWLVFGVMAVLAVGFVTVPLLRRAPPRDMPVRADYDVAVYKDQLRDVERDRQRGVLDGEQAGAARLEIERRLLAAAAATPEATPQPASAARSSWPAVMIVALIVIPAASLIYLHQGAPWLDDRESASRVHEQSAQQQFTDLLVELEGHLATEPNDKQGWMLLARGYARQGRRAEAEVAQQRALSLAADDTEAADIAAGFGQILIEEAHGTVTMAARAAMVEALRRNPAQPQARYFMGLSKLQAGDSQAALTDWQALFAESPPEAPWRDGLAEQITRLEAEVAVPTDPAAGQAMIESMVASLAARLEEVRAAGGGTAEEWAQLGRSYRVLDRAEPARAAYAEAVKRDPDNIALLRQYATATAAAMGETSAAYRAALEHLRDRLAADSAERAEIEDRLKKF